MKRALVLTLALGACVTPAPDPHAYEPLQLVTTSVSPLPPEGGAPTETPTIPQVISIRQVQITAICRDGWTSYSPQRRGTCVGHRGVREWVNRPAE